MDMHARQREWQQESEWRPRLQVCSRAASPDQNVVWNGQEVELLHTQKTASFEGRSSRHVQGQQHSRQTGESTLPSVIVASKNNFASCSRLRRQFRSCDFVDASG